MTAVKKKATGVKHAPGRTVKPDARRTGSGSARRKPAAASAAKKTPAKKTAAGKKAGVARKPVKRAIQGKGAKKRAPVKKPAAAKTARAGQAETSTPVAGPVMKAQGVESSFVGNDRAEMNMMANELENRAANSDAPQEEGRFLLPRRLELSGIEEVYTQLRDSLKGAYKKYVFDGDEVAIIDTAGIQFLIALINHLQSRGCQVSWDNYSVQVYQMADELGLVDALGD